MAVETLTFDLGIEEADEPQSGLGKGLSAILSDTATERPRRGGLASLIPVAAAPAVPDAPEAPAAASPILVAPTLEHEGRQDTTDLGADLVRALLDGLGSSMPLDLCAYLHQGRTQRPRLSLRSPSFSSFDPSDGFELCDLLGRRLRKAQSGAFDAAGFVGLTVATAGWASAGIFAVGRRRGALGPSEAAAVEAFCRQLGSSIHQLAEHHDDGGAIPRFTVEIAEAALGAEATVHLDAPVGAGFGHAWAGGRVEAVATALLKAIDCGRMFRYASEIEDAGDRRALVLLAGDDGAAALRGASAPGGTPGSAVAIATYRAAMALQH